MAGQVHRQRARPYNRRPRGISRREHRQPSNDSPGFRSVPRTGVIYVMHRAAQAGYGSDGEDWFNLGQGSPEVGDLPGAPKRCESLRVDPTTHTYGPVGGLIELREQVAELYNQLYRRGKSSQYTAENVSIAPGGRSAMTRVAAALGPHEPGALHSRLHRVRRAAVHLPRFHSDSHPPESRQRLRHRFGRARGRNRRQRSERSAVEQSEQPDRSAGRGRRARALGGRRPPLPLRHDLRRVLLPLHLRRRRQRRSRGRGLSRRVRRGRRPRPRRDRRWPDKKLALPLGGD